MFVDENGDTWYDEAEWARAGRTMPPLWGYQPSGGFFVAGKNIGLLLEPRRFGRIESAARDFVERFTPMQPAVTAMILDREGYIVAGYHCVTRDEFRWAGCAVGFSYLARAGMNAVDLAFAEASAKGDLDGAVRC